MRTFHFCSDVSEQVPANGSQPNKRKLRVMSFRKCLNSYIANRKDSLTRSFSTASPQLSNWFLRCHDRSTNAKCFPSLVSSSLSGIGRSCKDSRLSRQVPMNATEMSWRRHLSNYSCIHSKYITQGAHLWFSPPMQFFRSPCTILEAGSFRVNAHAFKSNKP